MAEVGYTFSEGAAHRIKDAVERIEEVRHDLTGKAARTAHQKTETIWARLTEEGEDDLEGRWGWEEVYLDHESEWHTRTDAREGTPDDNPAFTANGEPADVGDVVLLRRTPWLNDPEEEVEEGETRETWKPGWAFGGGGLPTGQYALMVYQMVSQNEAGFDFVRAHPILEL